MALAACLITNEPPGLKENLLQARIEGKSWKQIADEYGYGSPGQARTQFKKVTGLDDFKIKGKKLENLIAEVGVDNLKKGLPPKPPQSTFVANAATKADDLADAGKGVSKTKTSVKTPGAAMDDPVMKQAFPSSPNKLALENTYDVKTYHAKYQTYQSGEFEDGMLDLFVKHQDIYEPLKKDILGGQYYSSIQKKYGLSFEEIDNFNWFFQLEDFGNDIWKAYAAKPTSETGFKAVKDMVWSMKNKGATPHLISQGTNVPDKVVSLILKDKWSLPAKGSKQYVTSAVGTTAPSTSAASYTNTVKEFLGEKGVYAPMTREQADAWVKSLGRDLSPGQFSALQSYTGSAYHEVNKGLRGLQTTTQSVRNRADKIKSSMKPIPEDVQVARGVDLNAFPGGLPSPGDTFSDPGFMSTSFGGQAAFGRKSVNLIIDLPKGTKARPLHQLSAFKSEREILLDAGTQFTVTGVEKVGSKTNIFMRARVREAS